MSENTPDFIARDIGDEIVRLTRDDKDAMLYMSAVTERIRAMAVRWGGNVTPFIDELWRLWAMRSPLIGLWVLLRDGRLVGHAVATVQPWEGEHVGWVHQVEADVTLTIDHWRRALAAFDGWATEASTALRAAGQSPLHRLMLCTPHPPEIFRRRAGFRLYRTLMDRPIGGV